MNIYLVGGAVRDKLLHIPVKEKDWVVVGATVDDMLRLGYRPVGKDFPVFLHPKTNEEYALARTERKVGRGYTGFNFNASPDVTLEEDLKRRDLTINAIAETAAGGLIDPYHGRADIEKKILRHVSPAFIEDPVRILRIARFAARFAEFGFKVAPETITLMQQMVDNGEVDALVAERVWKEFERALAEKNPEQFFQVLADCHALAVLFPQINLDSAGLAALKKAVTHFPDPIVRFAALCHELTDASLYDRYRVPSDYRELASLVAQHCLSYRNAPTLSAPEVLAVLLSTDAFRREERFKKFLQACEAVSPVSFTKEWLQWLAAAKAVDVKALLAAGFTGKALAGKINERRVQLIQAS